MRSSMRSRPRCRRCGRPPGLHPAVAFALAAFDRAPLTTSIAAVTDAIGLSAKRFIERFKSRSRRDAEALLSDSAIPARRDAGASRPSCRLGAGRAGLRLLRSGALHSRLPVVRGPHADRLSGGSDAVSEPRQISTIRRGRHLRRWRHGRFKRHLSHSYALSRRARRGCRARLPEGGVRRRPKPIVRGTRTTR